MRAVISVLGKDKKGIIAAVSTAVSAMDGNILDISQTVLRDEVFTMVMLVDIADINTDFEGFRSRMADVGREIGMDVSAQLEEIFESMYRV